MANYFQSNDDAWGYSYFNDIGENKNSYAGEKSKYFNSDGSLKSGYSQREIGGNSGVGEVATYRNESSDDDDGESTTQRWGIFGAPTPAPAPAPRPAPRPAPTPAPAPKPAPKPAAPVQHSPEIKQAQQLADTYKSDIISGKTSEQINNKKAYYPTVENQDYSKDTYINRDSQFNTQYDFNAKTFASDVSNKKSASQDFFNKKKDQVTTSSKFTEFMQ